MGCWNHTCAISNLPIMYKDEVYVFMLIENGLRDNILSPDALWKPLPIFFEGKYNDYGAVEDTRGPLLQTVLDCIKKYLFEMEQGENEYHDIAIKKDKLDVELLFDADHENRLFLHAPTYYSTIRARNTEKLEVRHIVIRKNILDTILSTYKLDHFRNPGNFKVYLDRAKAIFQEYQKSEKFLRLRNLEEYSQLTNFIGPIMFEFDIVEPIFESNNKEKIDTLIYQMAVYEFMNGFMNFNRRVWTPTCTGYGQEVSTYTHQFLSKLIIKEAKNIDKSFDY